MCRGAGFAAGAGAGACDAIDTTNIGFGAADATVAVAVVDVVTAFESVAPVLAGGAAKPKGVGLSTRRSPGNFVQSTGGTRETTANSATPCSLTWLNSPSNEKGLVAKSS